MLNHVLPYRRIPFTDIPYKEEDSAECLENLYQEKVLKLNFAQSSRNMFYQLLFFTSTIYTLFAPFSISYQANSLGSYVLREKTLFLVNMHFYYSLCSSVGHASLYPGLQKLLMWSTGERNRAKKRPRTELLSDNFVALFEI